MNARGCGTRKPGGLYLCCGMSPYGQPIEHFLIDPVVPIDTDPFRTPQIVEKNGLNHALVYIGEEFYKYVPNFVDEARVMGISRRIPGRFPIDKLRAGSTMMMVHRKARIIGADSCKDEGRYMEYWKIAEKRKIKWFCPKVLPGHRHPSQLKVQQCIGLLWPLSKEMVDAAAPFDYETGIFAAFPVTHIDYVKVPGQEGVPADIAARARSTDLQLNAVEE